MENQSDGLGVKAHQQAASFRGPFQGHRHLQILGDHHQQGVRAIVLAQGQTAAAARPPGGIKVRRARPPLQLGWTAVGQYLGELRLERADGRWKVAQTQPLRCRSRLGE